MLSNNDYLKLVTLYRQGMTVPELSKKFNLDYKTIIDIGNGPRVTVYDKNNKAIFNGFEIDAVDFCEKNQWSYRISH